MLPEKRLVARPAFEGFERAWVSRIPRIAQHNIAAIRVVFVGGVEQGALQA